MCCVYYACAQALPADVKDPIFISRRFYTVYETSEILRRWDWGFMMLNHLITSMYWCHFCKRQKKMHTCLCGTQRSMTGIIFDLSSMLFIDSGTLSQTQSSLGWFVSLARLPWGSPVFTLGLILKVHLAFIWVSEDLNCGPCACPQVLNWLSHLPSCPKFFWSRKARAQRCPGVKVGGVRAEPACLMMDMT